MGKFSTAFYEASQRISKKVVGLRKKNPRRLPWKDHTDWVRGRYFYFTIPYGIFYFIGAFVGFARTSNWFCLVISGVCGLVIIFLGIAHSIDYYRGVNIEAVYLAIPFSKGVLLSSLKLSFDLVFCVVISLFVCIFMSCVYGMGATLKVALPVAIVAGIAIVWYMYGLLKDHSDGEYYRENTFVKTEMSPMHTGTITDIHDLATATEDERAEFRQRVVNNLATGFGIPDLIHRTNRTKDAQELLEEKSYH